jgi:hypothetical protein
MGALRGLRPTPWVILVMVGALLFAMILAAVPAKAKVVGDCADRTACLQLHHGADSQKAKGAQSGTCTPGSLCALGCFVLLVTIQDQSPRVLSRAVVDSARAGLLGRAISPALRPPRSAAVFRGLSSLFS